jgi:hypothetical protein
VQKNQASRERGALVAVDEWLVAREIEQVRRGDADCGPNEFGPTKIALVVVGANLFARSVAITAAAE